MSGRRPWRHQAIESVPELSRRVGDRRFEGEEVRPVDDVADLRSPDPLSAEEFNDWIAALRQCRTPDNGSYDRTPGQGDQHGRDAD